MSFHIVLLHKAHFIQFLDSFTFFSNYRNMGQICYCWRGSIRWIPLPLSSVLFRWSNLVLASLSSSLRIQNHVVSLRCNTCLSCDAVSLFIIVIKNPKEPVYYIQTNIFIWSLPLICISRYHFPSRVMKFAFMVLILSWLFGIIHVFKLTSVLAYGSYPLSAENVRNLRWKDTWDLIIHKP